MKANVEKFTDQVSKNMGEYVKIDDEIAVESVGPYIVELYKNILSRREGRGAVSVSKKTENGYEVLCSNVFENLDDAKNVYIDMVNGQSASEIEHFIKNQG